MGAPAAETPASRGKCASTRDYTLIFSAGIENAEPSGSTVPEQLGRRR
jgi:hypothetical protein